MIINVKNVATQRVRVDEAIQKALKLRDAMDGYVNFLVPYFTDLTGTNLDEFANGPAQPTVENTSPKLLAAPKGGEKSPDGFWATSIVEAVTGGATKSGEIFARIQQKYKLPKKKQTAFYAAISQVRNKKLIVRNGDIYSLPAAKKSHHSAKEQATRATKKSTNKPKGKTESFPWTGAIIEAVTGGASTGSEIWEAIQAKHHLTTKHRQTFSVALPYARRHGYVIRDEATGKHTLGLPQPTLEATIGKTRKAKAAKAKNNDAAPEESSAGAAA